MNKLVETLDGLKTHMTCTAILVLLVCHWAEWMTLPVEAYGALFALALIFLREGVKKSGPPSSLLALLCASVVLTGCEAVAPHNDALVVRAEQTAAQAFAVTDAFLAWEKANPTSAEVHQFAEGLRKQAPSTLRALRACTKAYKNGRTDDNRVTLETVLAVVERMVREAQQFLPKTASRDAVESVPTVPLWAVSPVVVIALLDGLMRLIGLVNGMVGEAKRNKEWTPAEEAEIDAKMEQAFKQPHWTPTLNPPV